jgi:uncharacterized protein (TIGR02147 family)
MKSAVFDFTEYKDYIRFKIQAPENTRGYSANLARSAGMHGSFLSKVLNSHVHLTPDQAADFCAHWNLDRDETTYFLGLLNLARASSKNLQSMIRAELKTLRKKRDELTHRFGHSETPTSQNIGSYYSAWYVMCVHMLLQIPQFRTPQQLAKRLGLSVELVQSVLASLAEQGLAEEEAGHWRSTKSDLHLGRDSIWANVHATNWLNKTAMKVQEGAPQEITFSSVVTISRRTADEIKRLLIDDLEQIRTQMIESPSEELYYFGINFYRV